MFGGTPPRTGNIGPNFGTPVEAQILPHRQSSTGSAKPVQASVGHRGLPSVHAIVARCALSGLWDAGHAWPVRSSPFTV